MSIVNVNYVEKCINKSYSPEQYGPWSAEYDFYIRQVRVVNNPGNSGENFNVDAGYGDPVYIVWIGYGCGDSFGHASGKGEVVFAFGNKDKAIKCTEEIKKDTYSYSFLDDFDNEVTLSNPAYGYFEHLEAVEIEEFIL